MRGRSPACNAPRSRRHRTARTLPASHAALVLPDIQGLHCCIVFTGCYETSGHISVAATRLLFIYSNSHNKKIIIFIVTINY